VPGAADTSAYGINDAGQIVGKYDDSLGSHGFFTGGPGTATGSGPDSQLLPLDQALVNGGNVGALKANVEAVAGRDLVGMFSLPLPAGVPVAIPSDVLPRDRELRVSSETVASRSTDASQVPIASSGETTPLAEPVSSNAENLPVDNLFAVGAHEEIFRIFA
jgi:hypothetical protein